MLRRLVAARCPRTADGYGTRGAGVHLCLLVRLDRGQLQITSGTAQAFAIPASQAVSVAAQIVAGKASATVHIGATALLGVSVLSYGVPVPGQPASTGAGVVEVTAGTPAAAAGLAPGDVIVSLGGRAVTSAAGLRSVIDAYHPGNKTSVVWADLTGQTYTATVVLASGPVS